MVGDSDKVVEDIGGGGGGGGVSPPGSVVRFDPRIPGGWGGGGGCPPCDSMTGLFPIVPAGELLSVDAVLFPDGRD